MTPDITASSTDLLNGGLAAHQTGFPDHADEMNSSLRASDVAMYEAKAAGKHAYHLFEPVKTEGMGMEALVQ
jgi:predicted signal transduction protein with EAL and GGDEF domain